MPEISPHAIVEPTAEVADDVAIGPFCYVGPRVRIGSGCRIANNVTLLGHTTLGQRTEVFPMSVIGAAPPGAGEADGQCVLGEANAIREHVTIYAGADKPTRIGNHNLIMIASQIDPGAQLGDHGIFDNCTKIGASAIIEDYVRMSGFAAVADGARVGAYSFVAGYAGVQNDAPPYAMLQGFPVRVRGLNTRNLKACGFGEQDIHALKAAFRELFNGRGVEVKRDALDRLAREANVNPYVRKLTDALKAAAAKASAQDGQDD
jgi:UDP-N-acetylglucosamine acyltransferase